MVSVIIINYNTFSLTCECISSIYEKSYKEPIEIILVDNASKECSPDIFLKKFPNVKLIKSSINLGFSKGNNLGIQHAKGEYILLLNSDTVLKNNAIELALDRLKRNDDIGVISVKLIYPNGDIQAVSGSFSSLKKEFYELLRLQKILPKRITARILGGFYFDHQKEMFVDWVWGAFFLTRREVLVKLPDRKLPDNYFMYFEDIEWCYTIKNLGYKILYYPQGTVVHYLSGSSSLGSNSLDKMQKILPNEYDFLRRNYGVVYTYFLFLLRTLKYISLRKKSFVRIAKVYLIFLFNRRKFYGA